MVMSRTKKRLSRLSSTPILLTLAAWNLTTRQASTSAICWPTDKWTARVATRTRSTDALLCRAGRTAQRTNKIVHLVHHHRRQFTAADKQNRSSRAPTAYIPSPPPIYRQNLTAASAKAPTTTTLHYAAARVPAVHQEATALLTATGTLCYHSYIASTRARRKFRTILAGIPHALPTAFRPPQPNPLQPEGNFAPRV